MPATIKDIAEKSGVSIGTVDRVIHSRGRASQTTVSRVRSVIRKLGYTTNVYARSLSVKKHFLIAVIMPQTDQDSGYWKLAADGIIPAQKEFLPYGMTIKLFTYNRYRRRSFQNTFKQAVKEEAAGILGAFMFPDDTRIFCTRNPEIRIALFDSSIDGIITAGFAGQNSLQSGILAGKLMRLIAPQGTVISACTAEKTGHLKQRLAGFSMALGRKTKDLIIPQTGSKKEWEKIITEIDKNYGKISGIFTANADAHFFACSILKKKNKNLRIIGYDLTEKNRHALAGNTLDFIIEQRPALQVREGIKLLYRALVCNEQIADEKIIMPLEIITGENLDFFQNPAGINP